jgi:hypothetical protein
MREYPALVKKNCMMFSVGVRLFPIFPVLVDLFFFYGW